MPDDYLTLILSDRAWPPDSACAWLTDCFWLTDYASQYYTILCCTVLYYTWHFTVLYCTVLYCPYCNTIHEPSGSLCTVILLGYTVTCCTVLYLSCGAILCHTVPYCTLLYCTVLHCTVPVSVCQFQYKCKCVCRWVPCQHGAMLLQYVYFCTQSYGETVISSLLFTLCNVLLTSSWNVE